MKPKNLNSYNQPNLSSTPRGWHNRGYLSHCDFAKQYQMITYHLADSLPAVVAQRLHEELMPDMDAMYRKRIESYLDSGYGKCILEQETIAQIVANAWRHFDGIRYDLHAWVIMPNHVHLLIKMREISLTTIVHSWKSYTTRMINQAQGTTGSIWPKDYWDRFIRDVNHYAAALNYIRQNPVKAGLVRQSDHWKWLYISPATEEFL